MRKAESVSDRPLATRFKDKWVIYDWRRMCEEDGEITECQGFAIENYSDPHYGLEFDSREELDKFIQLLNSAANKVWGPSEAE